MSLIAYKDGILLADTLGLALSNASHIPRFHMQKLHKTPAGWAAFAYCGPEILPRAIQQIGMAIDASLINLTDRQMEYTPLLVTDEVARLFYDRKWIIVTGSKVYTHLHDTKLEAAFDEIPLDGFAFDGTVGETWWTAVKGFDLAPLEAAAEAVQHVYGRPKGEIKIDHIDIKKLPTEEKRRAWFEKGLEISKRLKAKAEREKAKKEKLDLEEVRAATKRVSKDINGGSKPRTSNRQLPRSLRKEY